MKSLSQIIYANQLAFVKGMLSRIKKNQGITLDGTELKEKRYTDGYQVSVEDVFLIPVKDLDAELLLQEYLRSIYQSNANNYDIGLWLDDGMVYIDYSKNVKNLNKALAIGKQYNQQALYDWANDEFVTVK